MGSDSQEVGLEAAILERVRNSSLVVVRRRRQCSGLSGVPKRRHAPQTRGVGRGASPGGGSGRGNARGRQGSANAGMSSEKGCANHPRRKPPGSGARIVRSGLVGPKARPSRRSRWRHGRDSVTGSAWRTRRDSRLARSAPLVVGVGLRKGAGPRAARPADSRRRSALEKRRGSADPSVPETDTGRRGEEPQARE
jgi:hypothetical protein